MSDNINDNSGILKYPTSKIIPILGFHFCFLVFVEFVRKLHINISSIQLFKKLSKMGKKTVKQIHNDCLWNSMKLSPPDFEFLTPVDIKKCPVKKALLNEFALNKYRDMLFLEMVTLSRFMNGRKNTYRSDKGFRTIEKISKVIERIDFVDLKSVSSLMKLNLVGGLVPSKQLCQWMLVKLQSNGMLLYRLDEYCRYSATKLQHRLRTGHNWIEVTVALAMISRIWSLANCLLKNSNTTYQKLLSVLDELPVYAKGGIWLPSTYTFPPNLDDWINQKESSTISSIQNSKKEKKEKNITSNSGKLATSTSMASHPTIMNINSYQELRTFINKEQKYRSCNANRRKHVSKDMDELQWNMFKNEAKTWIRVLRKNNADDKICIRRMQKRLCKWFS